MKSIVKILLINSMAILFFTCQENGEKTAQPQVIEIPMEDNQVVVTKEQFETSGMLLGQMTAAAFPKTIRANGSIDVPPKSRAAVSVYYGGYVKGLDLLPGQKVRKGQVLFVLENPDFVQMQQDYLEAKEQLTYLQSDYERQQTLAAENISSQKSYLKAESDLKVQQARSEGLGKKLEMLGISLEKVASRDFTSKVNIYAPISGFITKIGTSSGSFLNTSDVAVEITNVDHLHVELDVFEKDLEQLRKGQTIYFRASGSANTVYKADVYLIGSVVEGENRVVRVHGHLEDEHTEHKLIPGMYVEAEIETASDSIMALPEEAVVKLETESFILVRSNVSSDAYTFDKMEVHPGQIVNGMVAIPDEISMDTPVLIKGAFNLIQGEEVGGHHH